MCGMSACYTTVPVVRYCGQWMTTLTTYGISSSWQSAASSKIVEHLLVMILTHLSSTITNAFTKSFGLSHEDAQEKRIKGKLASNNNNNDNDTTICKVP